MKRRELLQAFGAALGLGAVARVAEAQPTPAKLPETKATVLEAGSVNKAQDEIRTAIERAPVEKACGYAYALGNLHGSKGESPRKRIAGALEAASEFSAGVCPPFKVVVS